MITVDTIGPVRRACFVQGRKIKAVGHPVDVHAYADRIVLKQDGVIVGETARRFGRNEIVYDPWHYASVLVRKPGALRNGAPVKDWLLPGSIEKVRRKLSRCDDGDRQMAWGRGVLCISLTPRRTVRDFQVLGERRGVFLPFSESGLRTVLLEGGDECRERKRRDAIVSAPLRVSRIGRVLIGSEDLASTDTCSRIALPARITRVNC